MRYLNTYENHKMPPEASPISDDMISDVNDIILEISDMGIEVDVKGCTFYPDPSVSRPAVYIDIKTGYFDYFYISGNDGNILDCILRLKEYADINDCEIAMSSEDDEYMSIEDFISSYNNEDLCECEIVIYRK